MRLTIPVELPKGELEISHATRQMIMGSCFAENIGKRLVACKFPAMLNPFGILYNPLSIAAALRRIVAGELFADDSPVLAFHGERWHSMLHHGDFSRRDKGELLAAVNETIAAAKSDGRLEKWVADYTAEADSLKETSESGESAAAGAEPSWLSNAWQSIRDDFYLCFVKKRM